MQYKMKYKLLQKQNNIDFTHQRAWLEWFIQPLIEFRRDEARSFVDTVR